MDNFYLIATGISILSFLFYGASCLIATRMVQEFERYGLSRFRILTGCLQIAGALGLLAGFFLPYVTVLASLGLALLMLMGLIVRIRIKDPVIQTLPALFYCLLNIFIFCQSLNS